MLHSDAIWVNVVSQGHRSKFNVRGRKCSFSAETESKIGKHVLDGLETVN